MTIAEKNLLVSGTLHNGELSADINGFKQKLVVAEHDGIFSAYQSQGAFQFARISPDLGELGEASRGGNPRAPMNGTIVTLLAEVGTPSRNQHTAASHGSHENGTHDPRKPRRPSP